MSKNLVLSLPESLINSSLITYSTDPNYCDIVPDARLLEEVGHLKPLAIASQDSGLSEKDKQKALKH
ncbi:MAG: hypothetical protein F6K41_05155 [Symploca sp. SIO3E6]|nr:hypothetical protein [Caldora sp. SIO3E6]